MVDLLPRTSSEESFIQLAKSRLAQQRNLKAVIEQYPYSTEASFAKIVLQTEAKNDEVNLKKLEKRNDAVAFNTSELIGLSDNEQVHVHGDKVSFSRKDTGEVVFDVERRGNLFAFKFPTQKRREAIQNLAIVGKVKQHKYLPVVMVKKEDLHSTLRKALQEFSEKKKKGEIDTTPELEATIGSSSNSEPLNEGPSLHRAKSMSASNPFEETDASEWSRFEFPWQKSHTMPIGKHDAAFNDADSSRVDSGIGSTRKNSTDFSPTADSFDEDDLNGQGYDNSAHEDLVNYLMGQLQRQMHTQSPGRM